jgi:hypothetical protein
MNLKPVESHSEKLQFNRNEDGTYTLTFKKLPALLFVSYDGDGMFDQLFLKGEYIPEVQRVVIESAVGELTKYTINSLAILHTERESK